MIGFRAIVKRTAAGFKAVEETISQRQERVALSRFGAFVRSDAQRSIRKGGRRKYSSDPGKPPKSHVGLLKRFILFDYSATESSVITGPKILANPDRDVPSILEEGGTMKMSAHFVELYPRLPQRRKVKARPYISPAYFKNLPKLPSIWEYAVRTT